MSTCTIYIIYNYQLEKNAQLKIHNFYLVTLLRTMAQETDSERELLQRGKGGPRIYRSLGWGKKEKSSIKTTTNHKKTPQANDFSGSLYMPLSGSCSFWWPEGGLHSVYLSGEQQFLSTINFFMHTSTYIYIYIYIHTKYKWEFINAEDLKRGDKVETRSLE